MPAIVEILKGARAMGLETGGDDSDAALFGKLGSTVLAGQEPKRAAINSELEV